MAAVTIANIRLFAPEFRDPALPLDSSIQACIDDATSQLAPESFLNTNGVDSYNLAVKNLACHFLAIKHPSLHQVQKVRAYEIAGAEDVAAYGVTRWGREFVRMRTSQVNCRLLAPQ